MKLFISIVTIFFIRQNNFTLEELEYLNIIYLQLPFKYISETAEGNFKFK